MNILQVSLLVAAIIVLGINLYGVFDTFIRKG